jgi:hypothetical protein
MTLAPSYSAKESDIDLCIEELDLCSIAGDGKKTTVNGDGGISDHTEAGNNISNTTTLLALCFQQIIVRMAQDVKQCCMLKDPVIPALVARSLMNILDCLMNRAETKGEMRPYGYEWHTTIISMVLDCVDACLSCMSEYKNLTELQIMDVYRVCIFDFIHRVLLGPGDFPLWSVSEFNSMIEIVQGSGTEITCLRILQEDVVAHPQTRSEIGVTINKIWGWIANRVSVYWSNCKYRDEFMAKTWVILVGRLILPRFSSIMNGGMTTALFYGNPNFYEAGVRPVDIGSGVWASVVAHARSKERHSIRLCFEYGSRLLGEYAKQSKKMAQCALPVSDIQQQEMLLVLGSLELVLFSDFGIENVFGLFFRLAEGIPHIHEERVLTKISSLLLHIGKELERSRGDKPNEILLPH